VPRDRARSDAPGTIMMDEKTKAILLKCARTYFTLKNWPKASAEYESLLVEFPNDPFILEPLAIAHMNLGDVDKAHALAQRAMDAFKAKGQPEKAEKVAAHFHLA
jgi:tetratricopeptide (TPR) repeat protein